MYNKCFLFLFIISSLLTSFAYGQNGEDIFETFKYDEFTGEINITTGWQPVILESKSKNVRNASIFLQYQRWPENSSSGDYFYNIRLTIKFEGIEYKYPSDDLSLYECFENLPKVYFLLDGKRIVKNICTYLSSSSNQEQKFTSFVLLAEDDFPMQSLKQFANAKDIRFKLENNVAKLPDTTVSIIDQLYESIQSHKQ